jgi:guanylate kinase
VWRIKSCEFNMKWSIKTDSLKSSDLAFIKRTKLMWIDLRYLLNKCYAKEIQDINLRISRRTTILGKLYFTWLLQYIDFIKTHCNFTTMNMIFSEVKIFKSRRLRKRKNETEEVHHRRVLEWKTSLSHDVEIKSTDNNMTQAYYVKRLLSVYL